MFFKAAILSFFVSAFHSAVFSAVYCGIKWLLSLFSICDPPGWDNFIGGGLALFILIYGYNIFTGIRTFIRFRKEPMFRDAFMAGLSWEEYHSGKSASNEYMAINGRNYYAELNDNDMIGRIDAPGFKQTYDRIIAGIVGQITNNKDDLIRFGNLLYSKNFYPISNHTKKEIVLHINSVIGEVSKSSKNGVLIMKKAIENYEQLFNAYVSVMSIHEEATRQIEELKG